LLKSAALHWSQDDSILYSTSCPCVRRRSYFGLRDCSALDLFPDELRQSDADGYAAESGADMQHRLGAAGRMFDSGIDKWLDRHAAVLDRSLL
jgi:hypothetical protein